MIELLRQRYAASPDVHIIVFNAWRNEHSNSMAAAMANQVIDELYQKRTVAERLLLSTSRAFMEKRQGMLTKATLAVLMCVAAIVFHLQGGSKGWDVLLVSGSLLLFLTALPLKTWWQHPFVKLLKQVSERKISLKKMGFREAVRQELSRLITVYPPSVKTWWSALKTGKPDHDIGHRYLLVVDDLDRCSDDKIVDVLETVQTDSGYRTRFCITRR